MGEYGPVWLNFEGYSSRSLGKHGEYKRRTKEQVIFISPCTCEIISIRLFKKWLFERLVG